LVDKGYNPAIRKNAYSDHASFADAGIPAIMFSAAPLTTYHTDADTIENMNPDTVVEIGRITFALLQVLQQY
jgi:CO dehydrogenase/acetyl-CoA synthase epsilon subunit